MVITPENAKLGLVSEPGEDVVAFRERCRRAKLIKRPRMPSWHPRRKKVEPKFACTGGPGAPRGMCAARSRCWMTINPLNWFRAAPNPTDKDKINKLHSEWLTKQSTIIETWKKLGEEYAENTLSPRRADVQVTQFRPGVGTVSGSLISTGRIERVPAYHQEMNRSAAIAKAKFIGCKERIAQKTVMRARQMEHSVRQLPHSRPKSSFNACHVGPNQERVSTARLRRTGL